MSSTRQFYTYLSHVLTRFDLGRDEFQMFKGALLDYLQRFVDEVSRHMPQLADVLRSLQPQVPRLCSRANEGQRLVAVDGSQARRAPGLEPDDWESLHAWFVGAAGRRADADNVRRLATDAMRSLLVNLRQDRSGRRSSAEQVRRPRGAGAVVRHARTTTGRMSCGRRRSASTPPATCPSPPTTTPIRSRPRPAGGRRRSLTCP